jgi:predicted methyltransferase
MEKPGSILLTILRGGQRSIWDILSRWPYSIRELRETLERLHAEGWIERSGDRWAEIRLTERGREVAQASAHAEPEPGVTCSACQGRGIRLPETWEQRFREVTADRPLPVAEYDQGFMRPEDTVARVAFMHRMGDVADRDILLLGDDDLVSVALALTGLPRRILVADVDERLGAFLERVNRKQGVHIEFRLLDIRRPLPQDLRAHFDTFVTDPVETLPGFELFLSRAAASLRGRYGVGYFGLTTLEASLAKWHRLEQLLLRMNFVITDILRDFSLYPERENRWERFYASYTMMSLFHIEGHLPDRDWYRSSFLRIEAVATPQPTILGECALSEEELYFDEETVATPRAGVS